MEKFRYKSGDAPGKNVVARCLPPARSQRTYSEIIALAPSHVSTD
jgi:hypothetical protein